MANDDLDLTFIRCPSCRSLVPATATRCRMCGYLLQGEEGDNTEAPSDDMSTGPKSRVRQRTLSLSESEREEIKAKVAEKDSEEAKAGSGVFEAVSPSSDETSFAVPDELQVPVDNTSNYEQEDFEDMPIRELVDIGPELVDIGFEEADADFEAEMRARRESLEAELARRTSQEQESQEPEVAEVSTEATVDNSSQESAPLQAAPGSKRKRRRRKKKKKIEADELTTLDEEEESQHERVDIEPVSVPDESTEKVEARFMENASQKNVTIERAEEEQQVDLPGDATMEILKNQHDGKLVAWFVYYQDNPNGVATEIREGRFFLGGSRLKNNDIVVPHESVSTPHCLIKADPNTGVFVQDLMSENGTFVKREGTDTWNPVPIPEQLNHGDWLKLGEYEVMVCVVPVISSEADE